MNVLLRITVFVVLLNIVPGWLVAVKISLLARCPHVAIFADKHLSPKS